MSSVILRNIAETFVNLHAIEQMQLRGRRRVDGVGRPKFDVHTGRARAHYHEIEQYGTFARSVALLTRRAAATLEQEARASSFRDAALAAHEAAGRATQAWRDAARSFPPPSPSVK